MGKKRSIIQIPNSSKWGEDKKLANRLLNGESEIEEVVAFVENTAKRFTQTKQHPLLGDA